MATGAQIREQTGLSRKALKLLGEIGVISKGEVKPHPSVPRGRTTLHPDEDLYTCKVIAKLCKEEGLSLREAAAQYKVYGLRDKVRKRSRKMASQTYLHNSRMYLLEEMEEYEDEEKLDLNILLRNAISDDVGRIARDSQVLEAILSGIEQYKMFDRAFDMLVAGYSPILVWNGLDLKVIPDFMLSHVLTLEINEGKPYTIIPLFRYIESVIRPFIDDEKIHPTIHAAPKVLAKEGNKLIEYEVVPHGYLGVELLERTAKVIGKIKK